jgi:hypothetical protein
LIFVQAAEYTSVASRSVAEDNARAALVLLSGATGSNSSKINGFFAPTQEKGLDGRVVYSECGGTDIIIEHGAGLWLVKLLSDKGRNTCCAYVAGGRGLEDCGAGAWAVDDGLRVFKDSFSTKIVAAANGGGFTSLNLSRCNAGLVSSTLLADFLRCLTAVTRLDVSNDDLSSDGAANVAAALVHLTALQSLTMSGNKLGSDGLKTLMGAVTRLTGLTSLDLGTNGALSDGVEEFSIAITRLVCLCVLNLADNKLGSDKLKALMAAVTRLTGLTSLNISRNELSADDCALVCGAAAGAGMTQLCALEAEGNGFSAASVVGCEGWRAAGCRNLTTTLFVCWAAVDTRA